MSSVLAAKNARFNDHLARSYSKGSESSSECVLIQKRVVLVSQPNYSDFDFRYS